ncbi:hypothetical protein BH23BAC1_BH23BAC1_13200 [soil metagenome]
MRSLYLITNLFFLIITLFLSSCRDAEGDFTAGTIGLIITGVFCLVVLFFFLFRPQTKRKGDKNPKP